MTTLTFHRPQDSYDLADWGGYRSILTSSHFQITDGFHATDVYGFFADNSTGVTSGLVTGFVWSQSGAPVVSISGLNLNFLKALNSTPAGILAEVLKGNDTIIGSYDNDVFYGYTGNDTFVGGLGVDTAAYDGGRSQVTVSASGSGYKVSTFGKVDTLSGIERIALGDGSVLALDVKPGENAGSAYRIYQAAFDRKPDLSGLKYWIKQMDAGASLTQVAQGVVNSTEFKALNPTNDSTALINNFYLHVLHRAPDAAGLQYWSTAAANGLRPHEILAAFSESTENVNGTAGALKDGIWM
ncbi:C-type lectin [Pseudomonas sp. CFII64]|uniref:DUF4214 domain-containing protein n=1 Tax=Pseudomonas sp. CFII64 TaxID=911242 RepID=UPI0003581BAD|nr:DUF4214 domain-containing protein [Pseudomonas sp. CFII64]EPJ75789.1 C-type lectin [Pseudomonas sp. CFII64]